MTLAPPRKRCKHSCVPVLLKACQQNLFPIDVKVTFSRVGIVFASILQLMFYFTLCEVTECSLMTKYNNLLTISLKKKKKGKVEIKTLVSEKYRWNHRPRCCIAIHVFSQRWSGFPSCFCHFLFVCSWINQWSFNCLCLDLPICKISRKALLSSGRDCEIKSTDIHKMLGEWRTTELGSHKRPVYVLFQCI